jgi:hypothetical protein
MGQAIGRATGQATDALCTLWRDTRAAASLCATAASRIWTGPRLPGAGVDHATHANDAALRSAASGLPAQAVNMMPRCDRCEFDLLTAITLLVAGMLQAPIPHRA